MLRSLDSITTYNWFVGNAEALKSYASEENITDPTDTQTQLAGKSKKPLTLHFWVIIL